MLLKLCNLFWSEGVRVQLIIVILAKKKRSKIANKKMEFFERLANLFLQFWLNFYKNTIKK